MNRKYLRCKILGCKGKPYQGGSYIKGFCGRHYMQYMRGIIDVKGVKLRELYDVSPFARALTRTLILVDMAAHNAEKIRRNMDAGDKALLRSTSRRLHNINAETAEKRCQLTDRDFIFGNIDLLTPSTLQRVLGDAPVRRVKSLTDHDTARIAWHLLHGHKVKEVASMFPAYSIRQVGHVRDLLKAGKLPVSDILSRKV